MNIIRYWHDPRKKVYLKLVDYDDNYADIFYYYETCNVLGWKIPFLWDVALTKLSQETLEVISNQNCILQCNIR